MFEIAIGNTEDHAQSTARSFDGARYGLTPAYDIVPILRAGGEATQAMAIDGSEHAARLALAIASAHRYRLDEGEARRIAGDIVATVDRSWDAAAQ